MNQMWILKLDELIVGMLDELKEQDELPSIMNGENCSRGVLDGAFQTGFMNFDCQTKLWRPFGTCYMIHQQEDMFIQKFQKMKSLY